LAIPGPHQSECVSFQSNQSFRDFSVRRFSRRNPWATAKRSVPSPTSITCPVCRRTAFESRETFLILLTPPTEPPVLVRPGLQEASSSTTPSSLGRPP